MERMTLAEYVAEGPHEPTVLPRYPHPKPGPFAPEPPRPPAIGGSCATVGELRLALASLPDDALVEIEGCDCDGELGGWSYRAGESVYLTRRDE